MTKEKENKQENKKEKKTENRHVVIVRFEKDKWHPAIDKAFEKKSKDVSVSGFRKGKVPKDVYIKKFGVESLYTDAVDLLVNDAFTKALEDSGLVPIVQPKLDINSLDDDHVEFQFVFTTKPEVKLKKYKGLKIEKPTAKVTKDEIAHELGHILERYTEMRPKEGKLAEGDIAVLDFEGFKGDVAFEGGKAENYELEIGSQSFIPGFEEGLIGLSAGEEKDIELSFPEDYHASDLAGSKVVFKVKLNEIKEKVERDLDADLFADLAIEGVDSKEKLEEHIKNDLLANKETEVENKYVDTLLEEVAKNVEIDIPEDLVEDEANRLLERFQEQLAMQGVNLELYYQITGSTEEDLKAQYEKDAYKNVLYRLMLEEIAVLEKMEIPAEELEAETTELAARYEMEKEEFLKNMGGVEMLEYDLKIRKTIELLKELNKK